MKKIILIGGAWPSANGPLHIGHIAGLLPGDVIARYHRAAGNEVFYVSGSDCHGTPITIAADKENKTPREISDFYDREFCEIFDKLGFSYDRYGKTSSEEHEAFVSYFHRQLYSSGEQRGYIYEKAAAQAYCPSCGKNLTDRLVTGNCPVCGEYTRGDQCDNCNTILEPDALIKPSCASCGSEVAFNESKHLYIALTRLKDELQEMLEKHPHWRKNAVAFTQRYLREGLKDRAITRDMDWGIDVPKEGFESKKLYVWAENVLGYLSMSYTLAKERGTAFEDIWGSKAKHYYVHGKDNIPFHTIILPALLIAQGGGLRLPDEIISSEYMTLEGRKISTSLNWAIWARELTDNFNPDAIRYFFLANGPERRDADFSVSEFIERNNGELAGGYGNLVNRTLKFIDKYFDGCIPEGALEPDLAESIGSCFLSTGDKLEKGRLKEALGEIFELVRYGNKYFDKNAPWKTRCEDLSDCADTIYNCVNLIGNLAVLLEPFLPFSSGKLTEHLRLNNKWCPQTVKSGIKLRELSPLFERLDREKLQNLFSYQQQ